MRASSVHIQAMRVVLASMALFGLVSLVGGFELVSAASVPAALAAQTGILKFHHMHDAGVGETLVWLTIQDKKRDALVFWVDMTRTPTPKKATLQFSNNVKTSKTIPADGRVELRLPKRVVGAVGGAQDLSAFVRIDTLVAHPIDRIIIGHKLLWTGQSEAAMTETLMNSTGGTPLLDELIAHPRCNRIFFYHAIAVATGTGVIAAGSAPTPQDDLPVPPVHGWVNCNSTSNFATLIKGTTSNPLSGFSKTGLVMALEMAKRTQWQVPVMIYSTAVVSTVLAAWSSQDMILNADVHSYIAVPRNPLNTASSLYNGQLHPLRYFEFAAIARFQGESNALENKTEFGPLLLEWHKGIRQTFNFNDDKLIIIETQLAPFKGSAVVPQYTIVRDSQVVIKALKYSFLVPTWDLHDEMGRVAGDNGLHNVNGDVIARRIVDRVQNEWFGPKIPCDPAVATQSEIEYDDNGTVRISVKFSGVRSTGLRVIKTPRCDSYPGCATAPSPIELRSGGEWIPVSSLLRSGDTSLIVGNKIEFVLDAAVSSRALIDGVRITTSPTALLFLGDGDPAYPVSPFVFLFAAPSQ